MNNDITTQLEKFVFLLKSTDACTQGGFIHKSYIIEKLEGILSGLGLGLHELAEIEYNGLLGDDE